MEREQSATTNISFRAPPPQRDVFIAEDDEMDDDVDDDFVECSDESDKDFLAEDGPCKKRPRKKERKLPLSEDEAERRRVLANSQERERMNRLNRALSNLRRSLPPELSLSNRRLSKIRTLRLAVTYIRGLSKLLAEDDAARSCPVYPPPHFLQPPQYPYYGTRPCVHPPSQFQSPAVPTPHPWTGDLSDEGYFSFCSSSQVPDSSFWGASYTATPPAFPHPNPHLSVLSGSAEDEGAGEGSSCAAMSPSMTSASLFPPCGPPWMSSTPAEGRVYPESASASFSRSVGQEDGNSMVPPHRWDPAFVTGGESFGVPPADAPPQPLQPGSFLSSPVHFSTPVSHHGHCHHPSSESSLPAQFSTPLSHLPVPHHSGFGPGVPEEKASHCSSWTSTTCAEDPSAL